ncbi:MAG TPA: Dabb family protein [Tepidisphaeraceae bacterium]|nr:Dabb family protein [Tepidisphaeraceae bacterium]
MFVHVVLFWLKPGTADSVRDAMKKDCQELMGKIPMVRHLWVGQAAMTPRPVVDNSYDMGLCVVLDDNAAHDVYQTHPLHLEFMSRYKAHWTRVQVYDFK